MTNLPTRTLGRTGAVVTQLGFGAMEVRGNRIWNGRPCSDEQAGGILNAVLDAGITLIGQANGKTGEAGADKAVGDDAGNKKLNSGNVVTVERFRSAVGAETKDQQKHDWEKKGENERAAVAERRLELEAKLSDRKCCRVHTLASSSLWVSCR